MEGDTGDPMVVNVVGASETSYELIGLQSGVRYSIRMQTFLKTQTPSVIIASMPSVSKGTMYYSTLEVNT